jgi:hypothetical protein
MSGSPKYIENLGDREIRHIVVYTAGKTNFHGIEKPGSRYDVPRHKHVIKSWLEVWTMRTFCEPSIRTVVIQSKLNVQGSIFLIFSVVEPLNPMFLLLMRMQHFFGLLTAVHSDWKKSPIY